MRLQRTKSKLLLFAIPFGLALSAIAWDIRWDLRQDQWKELCRSVGLVTPAELRERAREGEINSDDFPDALNLFIVDDRPNAVADLIAAGADPNKPDSHGRRPLELARRMKRNEILKILRP